ncbi:hypothetical protein ACI1UM_10685 [Lactococcus petauri]
MYNSPELEKAREDARKDVEKLKELEAATENAALKVELMEAAED